MSKYIIFLFLLFSSFAYSQNDVKFSHEAGFYDEPFYLKIDSEDNIIYSFQNNLNKRSKKFQDSIYIEDNITISFGIFNGDSIEKLGSRSFFINFNTDFSVVAVTISNRSLYDSISGIYMHGPNAYYDTSLKIMRNSNYAKKSERDVYVEIFNSKGDRIVNQDAGVRIFGGMTIYYPEKSLRFIARKKYGSSRFHADIFNDKKKRYKQFILRHSGNDYKKTRFKDVLSTTLAAKSDLDIQASTSSHLFVNSEYWGVYNIREKINEYYINNKYDCGTQGIDILQAFKRVEEGNLDKWQELLDFVSDNKIKEDQNYNHLSKLMDYRSFTNFWIHQIYFNNKDVRGNIRFWRSDSLDGRFRWILYDTDLGWSNYKLNLLDDFTSSVKTKWYNPTWATFLLRNLLSNEKFKNYFINQTAFLLNTNLSTENVKSLIEEFEERYRDEMIYHFNHRKKFQTYQGNIKNWQKEVDELKFFAIKRDDVLLSQLKKKFNLKDSYNLNIKNSNSINGKVFLDNNLLENESFSGVFFSDIPLPISIFPDLGFSYTGWNDSIIINNTDNDITIHISFTPNISSSKEIIINEIDYVNDCFEIFNQGNTDINLSGWTILDKKENYFIIKDCILSPGRFAVFHYNNLDNTIDSVIYNKIDFRISSVDELIAIYDDNRCLVDSVGYKLSDQMTTYSRNIPFDTLDSLPFKWINSKDRTIGYHNIFYTNLLSKKSQLEKEKARSRKMIYVSLSIVALAAVVFFLIRYRKRRSSG